MGSWWGKRRESSEGNKKKKKPWRQKSVSFFIGKLSNFDFAELRTSGLIARPNTDALELYVLKLGPNRFGYIDKPCKNHNPTI